MDCALVKEIAEVIAICFVIGFYSLPSSTSYTRAKKLNLCASDQQFVSYVRRVVNNPHMDIKYVTLETLAKVEDDIKAKDPKAAVA